MVGYSVIVSACPPSIWRFVGICRCIPAYTTTLSYAGSLQVYVYSDMLALLAGRVYDTAGLGDLDAHLTNTCCQSEGGLQEEDLVRLLSELPQVQLPMTVIAIA